MPPDAPARARLHPAAVTALAVAGAVIVGAAAFLVWLLAQPADPNTEATQRLVQWEELFERYRAANGALPDMPFGGYCLGDGFPVGTGGTANCRDYESTTYYTQDASASLMDALQSVGELPRGATTPVRGWTPWRQSTHGCACCTWTATWARPMRCAWAPSPRARSTWCASTATRCWKSSPCTGWSGT